MDTLTESEFITQVKQIATSLSEGDAEKISLLRQVVRSVSIYEAARDWEKKNAAFLLYFLNKFINDIWRHFGTDAPFEDVVDVVSEISIQLGESLLGILSLIEEDQPDQTYKELNSIIELYFNKLIFVETRIEKKYEPDYVTTDSLVNLRKNVYDKFE